MRDFCRFKARVIVCSDDMEVGDGFDGGNSTAWGNGGGSSWGGFSEAVPVGVGTRGTSAVGVTTPVTAVSTVMPVGTVARPGMGWDLPTVNGSQPVTNVTAAGQETYTYPSAETTQTAAYEQGYTDAQTADATTAAASQTTTTATTATAPAFSLSTITGSAYFWPLVILGGVAWWLWGRK
jgi:hypothetical protein